MKSWKLEVTKLKDDMDTFKSANDSLENLAKELNAEIALLKEQANQYAGHNEEVMALEKKLKDAQQDRDQFLRELQNATENMNELMEKLKAGI